MKGTCTVVVGLVVVLVISVMLFVNLFDVDDGVRFCVYSKIEEEGKIFWFSGLLPTGETTASDDFKATPRLRQNSNFGILFPNDHFFVHVVERPKSERELLSLLDGRSLFGARKASDEGKRRDVCLEDVVTYVNTVRGGEDGVVNTQDDFLDLDEQLDLLSYILKNVYTAPVPAPKGTMASILSIFLRPLCGLGGQQAKLEELENEKVAQTLQISANKLIRENKYKQTATYWAESQWHLNHNAGVTGQLKILYGDINEYLMLFGNRFAHGGYAGMFAFDLYDFVLEGEHETQLVGSMERVSHAARTHFRREEGDKMEGIGVNWEERRKGCARMKRGFQKVYHSPGPHGAFLLEYARGRVPSSLYRSVILPTIMLTCDWRSLFQSIKTYAFSVIYNSPSSFLLASPHINPQRAEEL